MRVRSIVAATVLLVGAASLAASTDAPPAPLAIRVVKSPSCGCCQSWVDYLKTKGFTVTVEAREEFTALKRANGVTPALESCHTAFIKIGRASCRERV